jgi:Terminase RNaseH-like domain
MEAIDTGRTQNADAVADPVDQEYGSQQRYGKVRELKRQRQAAFKDVWGRPDRDETPVPWERYSDRDPINDPPVEPARQPERPQSVTYSMGVDLARINDFTVVTILDSAGRQAYWDRWNKTSWARSVSGIVDVANRFKTHIYVDSTGIGDAIFEQLERAGLYVEPFVFTNSSKKQLMDGLAGMIEQGKLRLMDIPVQTGELVNYEYRMTAARNVQMTAPDGEWDDCVCALALAAWGIGTGGGYNPGWTCV